VLIGIKRIYDKPSIKDGMRILVDRLWPRGVRKDSALIDKWEKDVAPSDKLRKWFNHDPNKWEEFKKRYRKELESNPALERLIKEVEQHDVTLIYSAKDDKHNNAIVLEEIINERLKKEAQK